MRWFLQNNYVTRITAGMAMHLRESGRDMLDFSVSSDTELPAHVLAAINERQEQGSGHFFYGSTALERIIARSPSLQRQQLQDLGQLDPRVWARHRAGQLLNGTIERMPLHELLRCVPRAAFFVKPAIAQKAFTGMVVTGGDTRELLQGPDGQARRLDPLMLVDVSPVQQQLRAEYRFVVAAGQVVTGSQYREGALSRVLRVDDPAILRQAASLVDGWLPAPVSVLDMAVLANGAALIVEFNSIHSAGHYAMDRERICQAIELALPRHSR